MKRIWLFVGLISMMGSAFAWYLCGRMWPAYPEPSLMCGIAGGVIGLFGLTCAQDDGRKR